MRKESPARNNPKLLKVSEVADRLSVCPNTILNWIKRGSLTAIRLNGGKTYRIPESALSSLVCSSSRQMPDGVEEII
jgi:excisionase family DNA binding protein